MNKHKDERIGEWAAVGHMVLDGFWPVGAAYGTQVLKLPPVELLGLATFISSVFFLALTLKKGEFSHLRSLKILKGCLLYTACLLIPYMAIFWAAQSNSGINIALFTQSEVIFAALVGWIFLKERVQVARIAGVLCIVAANLIVLYNGSLSFNPASLILIFAPLIFVFGNATAKRLQTQGLSYAPLLLFRSGIGGLFVLLFSFLLEDFQIPSSSSWLFLFLFGFLAFGLPKAFWQIALNKIDLSKTTAIGLSYPAFSFVMAYFLLHEIPSFYQWLGLGFSFIGIYFLMQSSSRKLSELAAPID